MDAEKRWDDLVKQATREATAGSCERGTSARRVLAHLASARPRMVASSVLPLAAILALLQFASPPPRPVDTEDSRRAVLALINTSLENHLRAHGEYPERLDELLPMRLDMEYQRTPGGYKLRVRMSDGDVVELRK
jgi:hypothetical protein